MTYLHVAKTSGMAELPQTLLHYRGMIWALAMRDLASRYAGTAGGAFWAFVHPLAIVVIFYFVFAVGFRAQGPTGVPFILWFVCGLAAWSFFNETLTAITRSVVGNPHLIKKTIFPTETLPFVHLLSGLCHHLVFLLVLGGLLAYYGTPLSGSRLLVVYFVFCNVALLLGLGWLLSALQAFHRDVAQGLSIVLNLWFWITPIVWSPEIMPEKYRGIQFWNPVNYIVEGYRGILVFEYPKWPTLHETLYFWALAVGLLALGGYVFQRLKPEFAEVL